MDANSRILFHCNEEWVLFALKTLREKNQAELVDLGWIAQHAPTAITRIGTAIDLMIGSPSV